MQVEGPRSINPNFYPEPTDPGTLKFKKHVAEELRGNNEQFTAARISEARETNLQGLERRASDPDRAPVRFSEVFTDTSDKKIIRMREAFTKPQPVPSLEGRDFKLKP